VPYAADDNPRHRLDVFVPKERKAAKLPAIVFIHGGAWLGGDKAGGTAQLMPFVRAGNYVGVTVGYRLSPEAIWPAQIHDVKAAIRFVRANAAKYHIDPDRIAVWGASAGGHLVAMLGVSHGVKELEGDLGPHKEVSSKVTCVVNYFGVTDILAEIGQKSNIDRTKPNAPEAKLIGGSLQENEAKAKGASPVTYVDEGDAPTLTLHGDEDMTVPYDQGVRLDAALKKAKVASYLVTIKGGGHGFGNAGIDRVQAFLEKYLHGKDVEVKTDAIEAPQRSGK
jgi:acetyl esterase/lipase